MSRSYPGIPEDAFTTESKFKRLRVDIGRTSFGEGREYRAYHAATDASVVKFIAPVDFVLLLQRFANHSGTMTFYAYRSDQGTEGGVFGTSIPIGYNNGSTITPVVPPQTIITTGGTFTPDVGQSPREKVKIVTGSGTQTRSTIGGESISARGLPAGTYYLVFTGTDYQWDIVFDEIG